jgi:prepilin-type N-terminal cleavage/methylation domain-containing protein
MTTPATQRYAFSLIEILCVIALIAVLGVVLAMLLKETIAVERTQAAGFDKILQSNALADQFRADVAQAVVAPEEWNDYKADAKTLILQGKDGQHIVYRWRDGALQRFASDLERTLPVGPRVGVEFIRSGADPKLVRVRLHTLRDGNVVSGQSLEIAAALGGEWR